MSDQQRPRDPDDPARREFLRVGTASLGAALAPIGPTAVHRPWAAPPPAAILFTAPALERVRIGFVGVGGQGTVHVENLLQLEGVELRAICDIVEEKVTAAQENVVAAGQPKPAGYSRGPRDFERMCDEQELDLVFTATPWEWHVPVCLAAMKFGKHAVTEVPAAVTLDECWQLVEAAERLQKHCVMMENCCYDRREMLALHLVRRGVLGDLLHAECGYLHDLRAIKFAREGEGLWRRAHSRVRNGRRSFLPTTATIRGPTIVSICSRVPVDSFRGGPIGSTSKDGARWTSGNRSRPTMPNSSIRSGNPNT